METALGFKLTETSQLEEKGASCWSCPPLFPQRLELNSCSRYEFLVIGKVGGYVRKSSAESPIPIRHLITWQTK